MADRFGGRKTLLGTQIVSALIAITLAGLQLAGHLDEIGLVSGAILSGLAFAFALPARNVTVRRLVAGDEVRPEPLSSWTLFRTTWAARLRHC